MTQHTQGPWKTQKNHVTPEYFSIFGTEELRIVWSESLGDVAFAIGDDNARLIAAAPDLLVALEEMLEMSDTPPERNCSCHINGPCNDCVEYSGLRHARALAEEAIAKARGLK